ncbi:NlpC/P60 family protein [Streptomyces sp. NPDC059679]|uniref:NlpC/P60 family protein n=1 Tax=Streptomyces sp. NPDC059679 TaxID=3346903 RepID=UPI0036AAC08A
MPALVMTASPVRRRIAAAAAAATVGAGALAVVMLGSLTMSAASAPMAGVSCPVADVPVGDGDGTTGLKSDQIRNAQVIIGVGQKLRVPLRGQIVAIAAALQESGLQNLGHGDRDSLGLFQMRPSQGWGTRSQIMDPQYAARTFYQHLVRVRGWEAMSINDAAQAVERSGFPDAYAKHETRAVQIVAGLAGSTDGATQVDTTGCTAVTDTPSGATQTALRAMLQQVGKPYEWGATGPDSFDCSGLIVYGWRQAGYQLKVRTSQQMYDIATPVRRGEEKPGDLIFTEMDKQAGAPGPAHVLIVVTPGMAVEAPRTGLDVRVRKYNPDTETMKFGRLPTSSLGRLA